ncbi:PspC domain-containing protein [Actinomycetaceae bacterium UMB8039B]|uniref:PspC domain-containing protein n=1 Tax=Pauljensenia sp. UMB8040A TaxID=3046343 RepID=UPI00254A93BA|nr:PspC domain-containing protein [Pauljensenia sp. UMB8040A]MDK6830800.1 PspC domain-containing protein [Pauljensenia sp. UMB8040A]MDK7781305.1 PspC domain-containing protein [Actinomycetaceae bacterium UMB8041B]MDK8294099.1 PspC domain-containing protein [Actinomycetaceae bacterium UMB8039B]
MDMNSSHPYGQATTGDTPSGSAFNPNDANAPNATFNGNAQYPGGPGFTPNNGTFPPGQGGYNTGGGFFASIRRSGWYRPSVRTIGGVCAAISARTGWDLALVRGLSIVAMLVFPPLLAAYGLGWGLLPDQMTGRIHAQELVNGRFESGQAGAILFILMGSTSAFPFSVVIEELPLVPLGTLLVLVAIIVIAVILLRHDRQPVTPTFLGNPPMNMDPNSQPGHSSSAFASTSMNEAGQPTSDATNVSGTGATYSTPHPGMMPTPAWAASSPNPTQPATPYTGGFSQVPNGAYHNNAGTPYQPAYPNAPMNSAPYQAPNTPMNNGANNWIPPLTPFVRSVGRRTNLVVTGLVLLAMATTFGLMYYYMDNGSAEMLIFGTKIGLIGGGICMLITGLALAIASMRGRKADWLVALSIIGAFLSLPTVLFGIATASEYSADSASFDYSIESDWTESTVYSSRGRALLDLSQAPAGTSKEIVVDPSVSDLEISARTDQPVRIICETGIQEVEYSFDNTHPSKNRTWVNALRGCNDSVDAENPVSVQSPTFNNSDGITVRITSWMWSFNYKEDWYGNTPAPSSTPESDEGQSGSTGQSGALDQGQSGSSSSQSGASTPGASTSSTTSGADVSPVSWVLSTDSTLRSAA